MMLNGLKKFAAASMVLGSFVVVPVVELPTLRPSTAEAALTTYTGVGESRLSEVEPLSMTKLRAGEQALRRAIEQAEGYLQNSARMNNAALTSDEISALVNMRYDLIGAPTFERIINQVTELSTAVVLRATVNISVDDDEVQRWLSLDDKQRAALIEQNKETQRALARQDARSESLRQQYFDASSDDEKARLKAELETADREFLEIVAAKQFKRGEQYRYQDYEKAVDAYTEAIELSPTPYVLAYLQRGRSYYFDLDDKLSAIADFTKVIELDPKNVEAYNLRGDAYSSLEDYKEDYPYHKLALADFTKAIELDPQNAEAYDNRGFTKTLLKEYESAIADFDKAIKLAPKNDTYCIHRGETYEALKDYARAVESYTAAIELVPTNKDHYKLRAEAYEKLGEHDKARADFDVVEEREPEVQVYSIEECDAAITRDPQNWEAYFNRGNANREAGNYDAALEDYTKAIKLNPKSADAYCNRGRVYHKLKKYDRALKDYTRAIELNPHRTDFYRHRAKTYLRLKDMEKWEADFKKSEQASW